MQPGRALLPPLLCATLTTLCAAAPNATAPPRLELVVARYNEEISWLADVDTRWTVTLYNKNGNAEEVLPTWPDRPYARIDIPNTRWGNEGETHALHIVSRYDSLADYTVFCQAHHRSQAAPFIHAPHLLALLSKPEELDDLQPLSLQYLYNMVPLVSGEQLYRAERISLRTLDSVYWHDGGIMPYSGGYLSDNRLHQGQNIIHHILGSVGLNDWIPQHSEVGSFAIGAIFGASRARLLRHGKEVYARIPGVVCKNAWAGVVWERAWLMMLEPSYADCTGQCRRVCRRYCQSQRGNNNMPAEAL